MIANDVYNIIGMITFAVCNISLNIIFLYSRIKPFFALFKEVISICVNVYDQA